jgi:type I restriction enzyme S subunit
VTLPASWCVKPLKHAAHMNLRVLPESTDPDYLFDYIDISNVNEIGDLVSLQQFRFKDAPSRARRIVVEGDTLISTVRTYLRAIHFVSDPRPDLIASTGFAVLHPLPGILPEFLWRVVQSTPFVERVVAHSDGVGYPAINPSTLGALPFWFPPEAVQRAVVALLRRETARVDALIEKKGRLITLLEEKRAALINRVVTKGLDPSAPMKDSGIPWLDRVPAHWQVRRIAMAADTITNGYVGPTRDILVGQGVGYLQSLHIKNGQVVFDRPYYVTAEWSATHQKSVLREGDLLIVQTGDLGQCCAVGVEHVGFNCHALIIVRLKPQYGPGAFLSAFLRSHFGQAALLSAQTGALLPHLECGKVREILVPFPPVEEQHRIISRMDTLTSQIDAVASKTREQISKFHEYRTALISAAVTGKIDVRGSGAESAGVDRDSLAGADGG